MRELQEDCRQCGAVLAFSPGASSTVCTYCGATNDGLKAAAEIVESDLNSGLELAESELDYDDVIGVACRSCKASFAFEAGQHAGQCPYCGDSIVKATNTTRAIKPSAVAPFELAESEARRCVRDWLGQLWFAPSGLTKLARSDGLLQGYYLPYWTFDSTSHAQYTGRRGDIYYEPQKVSVTVNGRQRVEVRQVRKVRWRHAAGQVHRHFDDLLIAASRHLEPRTQTRLGSWNLSGLQPYSPRLIQGFFSQSYDKSLRDGFSEAKELIKTRIQSDIRLDIGGDLQQIHQMQIRYSESKFKHILLPVWLGSFRYAGRSYSVAINGQTGMVGGERPFSRLKIALAVTAAIVLLALVAFFVATQGNLGGLP